ncbi:SigE family RNA polymerase sigma factor [Nocardioides cynanchi]|uniref:SigE family RNA polymerase sigma factor n=1 Tax=Nocardioides cynanchi TaxID=2558918 RepID=UPI00124411C6|nr:SigE family RNA polymerase sigma factor [Nocardioides cynanchi]
MKDADRAEFEQFVDGHGRELRRTAYLMCGDWQRAEDATQDALLKLYGVWSRLERSGGLRSYAHRAVTTAVLDQGRRPWRREVSTWSPPDSALDPTSAVDRRLAVLEALQALPHRRRQCLVLRYFADLSVEDTAQHLGISHGTVKSQTARALDQVRTSLVALGLDVELEELS